MSLNGLDASAVAEAHQAALSDPAGWFLLKYANRDTVEILSRGTGGIIEAKSVIEQYEEKSPLYGLVHYRRKKVILKYVPVGTSRLLQVRLTVQFQSVLDAFSHDAVFSFSAPTELSESALGLAAMLQPSPHGTSLASSAASIKHRRLDEISEDAEEPVASAQSESAVTPPDLELIPPPPIDKTPAQSIRSVYEDLPPSALRAKALLARRKKAEMAANGEVSPTHIRGQDSMNTRATESTHTRGADSIHTHTRGAGSMHTRGNESLTLTIASARMPSFDKSLPATPVFDTTPTPTINGHIRILQDQPPPPIPPKNVARTSTESPSSPRQPWHTSNHLSPNASDSINQWNDQVAAYVAPLPKPKKKLGPRPHIEIAPRPKTSSNSVAIPQTVRASSRQGMHSETRPTSRQSSRSITGRMVYNNAPPPPMPVTSEHPGLLRPPEYKKPPSIASSTMTDASTTTPEKLRLMKTLQMRKRNQMLAQRATTSQSNRPETAFDERAEDSVEQEQPRQFTTVPATPAATTDRPYSDMADHKRGGQDSMTASPVSVTTRSGTESTKPSSLSGDAEKKESPRTSSINTDSSATPKAIRDKSSEALAQSPIEPDNHKITYLEVQSRFHRLGIPESPVSPISPMSAQFMRVTGASTPDPPETIVQQPSPIREVDEDELYQQAFPMKSTPTLLELPPRTSSRIASIAMSRNSNRLTVGSRAASSSVYSDDDSVMWDIQNATLHEAMPISVARTDAPPTMRKLSSDRIREMTQPAPPENDEKLQNNTEEAERARTASMKTSTQPNWHQEEPMPPLSKKSTLGQGISKRIKALEVLTHRDNTATSTPAEKEATGAKTNFSAPNRNSFIAQFHNGATPGETMNPKMKEYPVSQKSVPDLKANSRPLVQRQGEMAEVFSPSRKGETISVTARIVRDQRRPATSATVQHIETGRNLHRSPLIVEHGRNPSDPASLSTVSHSVVAPSNASQEKSRPSFSSFRSGSTVRQYLADTRANRPFKRGPRSSKAPSETSSVGDDKKATRAGRFMKRVSGISSRFGHVLGPSKDVPHQETIMEQAEEERRDSVASSILQMIDIGDVNVQFPETLLWKRKFVRVDNEGYLVFSPPTDNLRVRTANRKFHLSELKEPVIPAQEREEMLWSIVLEMNNGSSIQCACESKPAQQHILGMLLNAHYAYNSLYA